MLRRVRRGRDCNLTQAPSPSQDLGVSLSTTRPPTARRVYHEHRSIDSDVLNDHHRGTTTILIG